MPYLYETMQIRNKVILSLVMLVIVLSTGLKVVLNQLIQPEFENIERAQLQENINHIRHYIDQEKHRLEMLAYDWAVWDQAYNFINGDNPAFKQSNLSDRVTSDLRIHQMFFVAESGSVIWSQSREDISNFLPDDEWPADHPLLDEATLTNSGLLLTPEGPYVYGRSAITNGYDEAQHNGIVVMLRAVDDALINDQETHKASLSVKPPLTWQAHTQYLSKDEALVVATIPFDNSTEQALHIQQHRARSISQQAASTIEAVFIVTIVMGFIATLLIYLFLRQQVLIPIARLNQEARRFGQIQSIDCFTSSRRKDEIGLLSNTFREMAEKIMHFQSNLVMEKQLLKRASLTDQLTGLYNRRYMDQILPGSINKSTAGHWTIVMLDLDHFKNINDTFGHDAGDLILKQFARLLPTLIREQDHCIRYGGEEFLLAMPDLSPATAKQCCERIRAAVQDYRFGTSEQPINVTLSQGFVLFSHAQDIDPLQLDQLQGFADTALYAAKHSGRNCWIGIDGRDTELPADHMQLLEQMKSGDIMPLKDEITPEFQVH